MTKDDPAQSETPRCDAQNMGWWSGETIPTIIALRFARELERELNRTLEGLRLTTNELKAVQLIALELNERLELRKQTEEKMESELAVLRKDRELAWTLKPPTESGTYWHWNSDENSAPVPMFVMYSGTSGKCFVSMGQLGLTHAIDCDEYGGWWMPLKTPETPMKEEA